MADESQPQSGQQQVQLRVDESKMTTSYANTIRTLNTPNEIILDFGVNIPMQQPNQAPTMNVAFQSRVVMGWQGAKRLAMSLGGLIRQYEEQFGEINLNAPQAGESQG